MWWDVETGGVGGAGALGVPGGCKQHNEEKSESNIETMHRLKKVLRCHSDPGVLVALVVLVSAVGVGLGSGDGVGRWRGGVAGRQAMAEVWSLL